uniref:EEV126 n=1 Tax=Lumpy skin disease virus TaxID=59509 RepID=A0A482GMF7_LSDV|nr:EEV126 [Lumpy skin disease virus]
MGIVSVVYVVVPFSFIVLLSYIFFEYKNVIKKMLFKKKGKNQKRTCVKLNSIPYSTNSIKSTISKSTWSNCSNDTFVKNEKENVEIVEIKRCDNELIEEGNNNVLENGCTTNPGEENLIWDDNNVYDLPPNDSVYDLPPNDLSCNNDCVYTLPDDNVSNIEEKITKLIHKNNSESNYYNCC